MIRSVTHHAGEIGPETYETWRATSLGRITEDLEQQLIMRMAGPLKGRRILDVGLRRRRPDLGLLEARRVTGHGL